MLLKLPIELAKDYKSNSQIIRVITEHWVNDSIFCPNCGNILIAFKNNKPVADFYCKSCTEEYELKSKNGNIGTKIVDGAYDTMINRLISCSNPNFFFLNYDIKTYNINNFFAIPKYFFITEIIEKRKPLSLTAQRSGWIGCNILINTIPDAGKIYYIKNRKVQARSEILRKWNNTAFLKNNNNFEAKGWLFDVLKCIEKLDKPEFELNDIYNFKKLLQEKYPFNNNIEAKIRQQLQILRDKNLIEFYGNGTYQIKWSN